MVGTKVSFVKYSANGNDFIILKDPSRDLSSFEIARMCDRHFGIGADGVLYLLSTPTADGRMRIFNSDGGEAEMCANGLRALTQYLDSLVSAKKDIYRIETMNGVYSVKNASGVFQIEMSEIKDQNRFEIPRFHEYSKSYFINTGVPHLVLLGPTPESIKELGSQYRFHKNFPNGTNVNFVEVRSESLQEAYVRTYERGVEDETFSCGTGLTATALALKHWFGWSGAIQLKNKGGSQQVFIGEKVLYSGEIIRCFEGVVEL